MNGQLNECAIADRIVVRSLMQKKRFYSLLWPCLKQLHEPRIEMCWGFFGSNFPAAIFLFWWSIRGILCLLTMSHSGKTHQTHHISYKKHLNNMALLQPFCLRPNHTEDFPNVLINHHRLATARFFKPLSYFDNLASSVPATSKLSNDNIASACELHVCPWSTRHMATRGGNLSREGRLCD